MENEIEDDTDFEVENEQYNTQDVDQFTVADMSDEDFAAFRANLKASMATGATTNGN